MSDLVIATPKGLYCPAGDFYIDPWQPVQTAVITHVHSDHARSGSLKYFVSESSLALLKYRIGPRLLEGEELDVDEKAEYVGKKYGEKFKLGKVWVSLHPAGHILGSAQVRIECEDRVWVLSGDFKRTPDPSCEAFEVVPCDTFISEATFALPIYHWESGSVTAEKIWNWWQSDLERPSLVFCYALGKAQRILAELKNFTDQKIFVHGAVHHLTEIYRSQEIPLLPTELVSLENKTQNFNGELILAPPSAHRSSWMKRFKNPQTAFASGWMQVRGARRRRGYEKGFVLSDHADWNELNQTIQDTGAQTVFLTHGKTDVLERYLSEKGLKVRLFKTEYDDTGEA